MPKQRAQGSGPINPINSEKGSYRAYFVGMTEPYEEVGRFNDRCNVCDGAGTGRGGKGSCFKCGGDGMRHETYVKLTYELENGNTEVEECTFKLNAGGGTTRDGKPISPSTLFLRMREFADMPQADAATLDAWYSSLTNIRVPITVNIGYSNSATPTLKITDVQYRKPVQRAQGAAAQPAPKVQAPPPAPDPKFASDDWEADEIPF